MELKLPLILDGSTGTQIQKRGFDGKTTAEEWSIAHPELIHDFQKRYIECGSDVIYAPTFGANAPTLESHHLFGKVQEFNKKLVSISKSIADGRALVSGDISPCGRYLYPLGDFTFEDLYTVYQEQAAALEEAGVDLFAVETQVSLADARAAILAIRSVSRKPILVTFTCDVNGRTMMGTDVAAALVVCQSMGIDAFGLNCSTGPDSMLIQLKRLSEYARIPLIAKPNAGLPETVDGKTIYRCTPQEFIAYAEEMTKIGVAIFGGCCGTTEDHIKALSEKVKCLKPVLPSRKKLDYLCCATEKDIFVLSKDIQKPDTVYSDATLCKALESIDDLSETLICLELQSVDDVQALADHHLDITKPLMLQTNDPVLLEKALRVYQGRALYDGSLSDDVLLPLARKYGMIL